ncbi:lactate utilization protein C [Enterovibrio sp. ZSDZ42]|uniref:Lactate utilization protein C n=1 Tax=Enterovibrio gelatinilyticus TaxID=2899819 RepID=A0ABT5QVC7_9GAMM|nr:lactate utilization protein C [Enterovibrio sp. ZSDZ42]MDD1791575.1 lactate utilization protein C [Enterovibrio sp. ZSDZ42]
MNIRSQNARAAIFAKLNAAPRQSADTELPGWQAWHDPDLAHRVERFISCMTAAHAEVIQTTKDSLYDSLVTFIRDNAFSTILLGKDNPYGSILNDTGLSCDVKTYDQPLDDNKVALFNDIDASLSVIPAGIADTGTLAIVTGEKEPRALSLVPPTHIAILRECDIVSNFNELMATPFWTEAGWDTQPPTNLLLISGPSKTADIQQTLAYGAHGPKRLIVFMVEE